MKIGLPGYLWRYVFYVIVVQAAVYGLLAALEHFAPDFAEGFYGSGGDTGLNVAAVMLPGIYLGQKWARTEGAPMPGGFGWQLALCCCVVLMLMAAVFIAWRVQSDPSMALLWQDLTRDEGTVWIVGAVTLVMVVLLTRLAIWSAVRGELKRQARLAARR